MLTKLEYLKKCILNLEQLKSKSWYTYCFAIPILKEEVYDVNKKTQYSPVVKQDGLYYLDYDEANNLVPFKIVDYVKGEPLLAFQDLIEVDGSWLSSIPSKIETKIGILIVNALVLHPTFKTLVDYINKPITVKTIEAILFDKVSSDKDIDDKHVSVSAMTDCIDRLTFLSSLATIIVVASTPRVITSAPGIDKLKKELLIEYKDVLNDSVKVAEMESKLVKADNEYLKDDTTAKNTFNKKARLSRKKLYLTYGNSLDFDPNNKNTNIIPSLTEGVDTSEENFSKYMNDLRSTSFDRGASTALAGYSYKILQRSLSGIKIEPKACNTTVGFKRLIDKDNYTKLINRYVKDKGWILITNESVAKSYVGKKVETRSPLYCKSPGNTVCYACMSENYKNTPSAVNNLAANISSVLLNTFLKKMHSTALELAEMRVEDIAT